MRNLIIAVCLLMPVAVLGQQLAFSFKVDSTLYEVLPASAIRSPETQRSFRNIESTEVHNTDFLTVFRKKSTDQCDIFSFSGKIGSTTVPSIDSFRYTTFSQTFIDADSGWECIAIDYPFFSVFDENGTQLMADTGMAFYGFDGKDTYVTAETIYSFKTWRFRTNLSIAPPGNLAKTASSPRPIMVYLPNGNFRVTLRPTTEGQTHVQIFDVLGRQFFTQTVQNAIKPQSFIVPAASLPRSPFIAKFQNAEEIYSKKTIPVR